jgi:hypothetical protein
VKASPITILVAIFSAFGCNGADQSTVASERNAFQQVPSTAVREKDLAKHLRIGMSKEDLFKVFGVPTLDPIELDGGVTRLQYVFEVDERNLTAEAVVSGFTVFLKDGKISRWSPSYLSAPEYTTGWVVVSPERATSAPARIEHVSLWIVRTNEFAGSRYSNTEKFRNLGFISQQPDLTLSRLKLLEEGQGGKWPTLRLTLTDGDRAAFHKLTRENSGKRTLIAIGSRPLLAPYINEPISSGVIRIPCDNTRECAELRSKLAALLPPP